VLSSRSTLLISAQVISGRMVPLKTSRSNSSSSSRVIWQSVRQWGGKTEHMFRFLNLMSRAIAMNIRALCGSNGSSASIMAVNSP
jgi:hypothetical protein